MAKRFFYALALLGLSACAVNGFQRYYSPQPGADAARPLLEPFHGEPQIYTYSDDPRADVMRAREAGYLLLGTSSFYGPPKTMTRGELVEQAKSVGASMILVHSQYKDTLSGTVPYTVANPPQISTVNTSGTVNSYGSGGYATGTYSGQSTITSPGGSSTYQIPYSVTRNDVVATFWAHQDPATIRLGVIFEALPENIRAQLQRNTGILAAAIIQGTPAFRANILRGDVITRIGGEEVTDAPGFSAQLKQFAGQTVDIELVRGGTSKIIKVTLNPGRSP